MKVIITLLCSLITAGLVEAQTACDSISIDAKYAAFADTLIEVTAYNHGHTFYSYPGFILYNSSGDTVAKETVNFFGIGTPSSHQLRVRPGNLPGNTFTGSLQLWTGFYTTLDCSYQMSFNLCPDTCEKVHPYFGNYGGAYFFGTVNWALKNSGQQTIASGMFTLDSAQQFVEDSTCIMPGNYTLNITPVGSVTLSGQPVAGVRAHGQSMAPQPYAFFLGSAIQTPFVFYKKCMGPTIAFEPPSIRPAIIFTSGGILHVYNSSNEIGQLTVYTMEGKAVYSTSSTNTVMDVDISTLPAGIYIVQLVNSKGQYSQKVALGL